MSAQDCDHTSLLSSLPTTPLACMLPSLTEVVSTHLLSNRSKVKRLGPESILPIGVTPGSAGYELYAAIEVFIPPEGSSTSTHRVIIHYPSFHIWRLRFEIRLFRY